MFEEPRTIDGESIVQSTPGMQLELVNVSDLQLSEYQRKTKEWHVARLAKNFDPIKAGVIVVSKRDGKYYLIDGAHRVIAMRKRQFPVCPAIVLTGLTAEQEADYFRKQGENTCVLSQYEKFKAGIYAVDPIDIEIDQIVKKNDFAFNGSSKSCKKISAVGTIKRIYLDYTADILDQTLMLFRTTWGAYHDVLKKEYLLGMAEFVKNHGTIDFSERFQKIEFKSIHSRYRVLRESQPNSHAFYLALVEKYNENIVSKKKLEIA
jgi:hypothetical protein